MVLSGSLPDVMINSPKPDMRPLQAGRIGNSMTASRWPRDQLINLVGDSMISYFVFKLRRDRPLAVLPLTKPKKPLPHQKSDYGIL